MTVGLCLLMFISCKKNKHNRIFPLKFDQSSLPIIANNGQNYYGYLLDNRPIWAQKNDSQGRMLHCYYVEKDNLFYLDLNGENKESSFSINIKAVLNAGETYVLKENEYNSDSKAWAEYSISETLTPRMKNVYFYVSNNNEPGYIKILQLNKQKRTISGVFEVKVRKQWGTQTMNITKGRFDVTYETHRPIVL